MTGSLAGRSKGLWFVAAGVVILMVTVAIARVSTRAVPASASFAGGNGKIALSSNRDGNSEVYLMNSDGTGQTRLTNTTGIETYPHWSPDGLQIAFDSSRDGNFEIYVMDADGSAQTRRTNNSSGDMQPVWSPDGTKIAFTSWRTGAWQIYVMNADGSGQMQLTSGIAQNWGPAWSPDGSKIAFGSDRDGNYNVFVMSPDGSGQASLTNGPANESAPNWSPDGSKLTYMTGADIYAMDPDGGNKTNLTNNGLDNAFPAWSPDGTRIVFQSGRDGNSELYVMSTDGSAQTRLAGTGATEAMPDWQPFCETSGCSLPSPVPSPTPCPEGVCPTPTPTALPTLPPTPTPGSVDFSIGISRSDGSLLCDSSGTPTATCDVPAGAPFGVNVYLNQLPLTLIGKGYVGYDSTLLYQGVALAQGNTSLQRWPDCVLTGYYADSGRVAAGCAIGVAQPGSTYTGLMATIYFSCISSGTITLEGGAPHTDLVDQDLAEYDESSNEALQVTCVDPQPYPDDTDADRCPDVKEAGPNPMIGGQRSFVNPWDYFNPTGDGKNRVDDILAINQHFGRDAGNPGYDTKYDRTFIGPNKWNLGPPDGKIRVADILAAVSQFGQDCS